MFQSIMSYLKAVLAIVGFNFSFGFALTLRLTKFLSDPKTVEVESLDEIDSENIEKKVSKLN